MFVKRTLSHIRKKIIAKIRGEFTLETLIQRGLKVGKDFHMERTALIDDSHCFLITIGDRVTIAPRVHILAHDSFTKPYLGYTRIGRVTIGDDVCIGAETVILPNVTIGNHVVIGAGSVVTRDIPDGSIAAGNPARVIDSYDNYKAKNEKLFQTSPHYDESWTFRQKLSQEKQRMMYEQLENKTGFVK